MNIFKKIFKLFLIIISILIITTFSILLIINNNTPYRLGIYSCKLQLLDDTVVINIELKNNNTLTTTEIINDYTINTYSAKYLISENKIYIKYEYDEKYKFYGTINSYCLKIINNKNNNVDILKNKHSYKIKNICIVFITLGSIIHLLTILYIIIDGIIKKKRI